MAKVNLSLNLGVPASKLWDTIGGFNALPDWHPAIEKSEVDGQGEGSVRTLTLAGGGGTITERLDNSDAKSHSYTYSILDGPPSATRPGDTHADKTRTQRACCGTTASRSRPAGSCRGADGAATPALSTGLAGRHPAFRKRGTACRPCSPWSV